MANLITPSVRKNVLVFLSLITFLILLRDINSIGPVLSGRVQHVEFIILGSVILVGAVLMFLWSTLGVVPGLISFLAAMIFLYRPLTATDPQYYAALIVVFFVFIFKGYHLNRKYYRAFQNHKVTMEKISEDNNLISDHMKNRDIEVSAMGKKIDGLLKLKGVADKVGVTLKEDEILSTVARETFDIFRGDNRVLLFTVKGESGGLNLSYTLKGAGRKAFESKKGGIFDSWAIKNTKSLLVRDVKEDFRFSVKGKDERDDAVSLMVKPLILEGMVLGVLRVDSPKEAAFTPHELRMLDIIGDLAAVAMENARLYQKTENLAVKDSLTGLYVHRYFMERLDEEVKRALRSGSSFALLMLDVDDFKVFNDEYGHMTGDAVLQSIGGILKNKASAGDTVARYGGEEFAFLALNTDRAGAMKIAEEIRAEIEKTPVVVRRKPCAVTASIGVSVFPEDARLKDDIIMEADKALYKAKKKGKNRTCSK
jgi:diguanylate cyclase (GGDEF)-like protein